MRYSQLVFAVILVFFASRGYTEQNPADSLTDQRRIRETWLRLEADRNVFQADQPEGGADQTRLQNMRLQQQRLRDRQNLWRENKAAGVVRQQQRAQKNVPSRSVDPAPGIERLKSNRRHDQLRLHNRMQRYSWPRNRP